MLKVVFVLLTSSRGLVEFVAALRPLVENAYLRVNGMNMPLGLIKLIGTVMKMNISSTQIFGMSL